MNEVRKHALVTGGSSDIGAAICQRLVAAGHFVHVHAHRNMAVAEALAAELNAGGQGTGLVAATIGFDVTDGAATRRALESLTATTPIQILVNNAGLHDDAVFPGMTAQQWHGVMDVCVDGFFNVTQALLLPMLRTRWGRIVNISSVASLTGNRGQVNYSAAKGAINAATRSLALEVASRGVTVNAIAPGVIASRATAAIFDAEAIKRLVPMNRAGRPEEIADAAAFLCSEASAYITGQVVSVNGGII